MFKEFGNLQRKSDRLRGFADLHFQRKTDLWQKALTFCDQPDHKFYTNCQPVLAVAAPRVPFSTGPGHPLGIPGFGPSAEPQATH
jgi:hypothetical protein